jgi:23S rRNA (cytidine2498-2'-O)-methyltransferase
MQTNLNCKAIYIAGINHLDPLCKELGPDCEVYGDLVLSPRIKHDICFAQDVWLNPQIVAFESIGEAVRILRAVGKFWFLHPYQNVRRSRLIESELRKLPDLAHSFPVMAPLPQINCFTLLDKNTLAFSTQRWKNSPLGDYRFIEDKQNPPNRAYLKLWEALTLFGVYPTAGETAMDLGASPGGWTYVMQTFGTHVTAVDKAELEPRIARLPNVSFLKQSAFALDPAASTEKIDWLLCDIACYPERTYQLITQWLASGRVKNMIFTIKLQGETDLSVLKPFQDIPDGRVIHLFYNKHEVTFFYKAPEHLWI